LLAWSSGSAPGPALCSMPAWRAAGCGVTPRYRLERMMNSTRSWRCAMRASRLHARPSCMPAPHPRTPRGVVRRSPRGCFPDDSGRCRGIPPRRTVPPLTPPMRHSPGRDLPPGRTVCNGDEAIGEPGSIRCQWSLVPRRGYPRGAPMATWRSGMRVGQVPMAFCAPPVQSLRCAGGDAAVRHPGACHAPLPRMVVAVPDVWCWVRSGGSTLTHPRQDGPDGQGSPMDARDPVCASQGVDHHRLPVKVDGDIRGSGWRGFGHGR